MRNRLAFVFTISLFQILLIVMFVVSSEVSRNYKKQFIQAGYNAAYRLALKTESLLQLGLYPEEFSGFEKLCQSAVDDGEEILYAALLGGNKKPLFQAGAFERDSVPEQASDEFVIEVELSAPTAKGSSILVIVSQKLVETNTFMFMKNIFVYASIVIMFGIVAVMYYLNNSLGKPIKLLIANIENINRPQQQKSLEELAERRDEIGLVASSIDELLQRLSFSQGRLNRSRTELDLLTEKMESQIEDRTKELLKANEKLNTIAHRDPLTGLYNRRSFDKALSRGLSDAKTNHSNFALVLVDLNDFKMVNDKYGHTAGDFVLSTIGERIRLSRSDGVNAFRIGGDELVLIYENYADQQTLEREIIRFRKFVLAPVLFEDEILSVGASIGVVCAEQVGGYSEAELIALADVAMYESKFNRQDYVFSREERLHFSDIE